HAHHDNARYPKGSVGEAPSDHGDGPSWARRQAPAPAIMAPLSVQKARLGRWQASPSDSQAATRRARRRELAATPPPMPTRSTPSPRAASRVLSTNTSTTASWKEAATS